MCLADPHMANKAHSSDTYNSLFDDIYSDTVNFGKLDFWVAQGDEATSLKNCIEAWEIVQNRYYQLVPTTLLLTQGNHDIYAYIGDENYPSGWHPRPYDNNLWITLNETNNMRATHAIYQQGILFLFIGDKGEHRILPYGQKVWLEHLTSLYPDTTTIIFSHEGQRDDEHTWPNAGGYGFYNDEDWWRDFFKRKPQIELWINGHGHSYNNPHNIYSVLYNQDPLTFILVPGFQNETDDKIGYLSINEDELRFKLWDVSNDSFSDDWLITTFTTFNGSEKGWISFPMFLEDEEKQWFDNKILSPDITLQLVGWHDREMFSNPNLTWFDQHFDIDWLYFGNDIEEQVRQWNGETIPYGPDGEPSGVLSIDGGGFITFPHKNSVGYAPWDTYQKNIDQGGNCYSHIGCSYEMFGQQPQGAAYDVLLTIKTDNGTGRVKLTMDCSEKYDIYKKIPGSSKIVIDTDVNETYQTYQGNFIIPNKEISIINGKIECEDSEGVDWYNISYISIIRNATGEDTKDFHLKLGKSWYNSSGILNDCEYDNFLVNPLQLMNESIVDVYAQINGNKKGFARLIYKTPVLMARNGNFKLNQIYYDSNIYNITAENRLSMTNDYLYFTPLIYDYGNLDISKGSIITTVNNNTFSKTFIDSTTFDVTYGPTYYSPYIPRNPYPANDQKSVNVKSDLLWSTGEYDTNSDLTFDVYFGKTPNPPLVSKFQEGMTYDPGLMNFSTKYYWKVVAWKDYEKSYAGDKWTFTTEDNFAPLKPTVNGPKTLDRNKVGNFIINTTELNDDLIFFYIDWDDGTIIDWDGPYYSNQLVEYQHSWNGVNTYEIKIKAKDEYDLQSDWTEFDIIIKNPRSIYSNWLNLFQRYPFLKIILAKIL